MFYWSAARLSDFMLRQGNASHDTDVDCQARNICYLVLYRKKSVDPRSTCGNDKGNFLYNKLDGTFQLFAVMRWDDNSLNKHLSKFSVGSLRKKR